MIDRIEEEFLADNGRRVSVAMIDSGFSRIPSYATLHGANHVFGTGHGNRMLSIFTALDRRFPLSGLELHLACYNPETRYDGLANAIGMLPKCDILSLSISWNDDNDRIRGLMSSKFGVSCVPYSVNLPYPALYGFTVTCSNSNQERADYCIKPNPEWRGNSYAVPAIARLMAYGIDLKNIGNRGTLVQELFSECNNGITVVGGSEYHAGKMACPHCHRFMRSPKTHGFVVIDSLTCPYCGLPLR